MLWKRQEEFIPYWWRLSSVSSSHLLEFHSTASKRNLLFKWSLTCQSPLGILTFMGKRPFHLLTSFGPHILLVEKVLLLPLAFSYVKECNRKGPRAKLSLILIIHYFLQFLKLVIIKCPNGTGRCIPLNFKLFLVLVWI